MLPPKTKQTVIEKVTVEDNDITEPKGIENCLNPYFTSIATKAFIRGPLQNSNTATSVLGPTLFGLFF